MSVVASALENTPVSGPHGPLTRRYAPTAATPSRDHSDGAQRLYIACSGSGLAGRGRGSVKPIRTKPASPGYRRHTALVQHSAASGAFMPLRGILGRAAHGSPA